MLNEFFDKNGKYLYFIFRIIVGIMFFMHGAQKLLGWFGSKGAVELFSLMGLAGIIELVGGLVIALGLFTRLASIISGLLMLSAYFMVHVSGGLIPLANGGELALLYFAAFLAITTKGAGIWGVEKATLGKEIF